MLKVIIDVRDILGLANGVNQRGGGWQPKAMQMSSLHYVLAKSDQIIDFVIAVHNVNGILFTA